MTATILSSTQTNLSAQIQLLHLIVLLHSCCYVSRSNRRRSCRPFHLPSYLLCRIKIEPSSSLRSSCFRPLPTASRPLFLCCLFTATSVSSRHRIVGAAFCQVSCVRAESSDSAAAAKATCRLKLPKCTASALINQNVVVLWAQHSINVLCTH
jgi:hypothetical protein